MNYKREMTDYEIKEGDSLNEMVILAPWINFIDPKTENVKPLDFVIEGFCARGHITVIGGKAGSGKSMLNQYLLSVRDDSVINTKQGMAIYLTGADSDRITISRRAKKFCNRGLRFQELPENTLCLSSNPDFMNELADALHHSGVDAVIFDTLADFHEGNLNEAERANVTMSGFRRLARQANVAVIIITHTTKGSNSKTKYQLDDIADSRIFVTKADFVFALQSEYQGNRNLVELQCLKSREMAPIEAVRCIIKDENDNLVIRQSEEKFEFEIDEFNTRIQRNERDAEIIRLHTEGLSYRSISEKLGVSKSNVGKIINQKL